MHSAHLTHYIAGASTFFLAYARASSAFAPVTKRCTGIWRTLFVDTGLEIVLALAQRRDPAIVRRAHAANCSFSCCLVALMRVSRDLRTCALVCAERSGSPPPPPLPGASRLRMGPSLRLSRPKCVHFLAPVPVLSVPAG